MKRGQLLGLAVASVALVAVAPADAWAGARATLVFSADGSTCGGSQAMGEAVAARLGYNPFRPEAELTVTVEIRAKRSKLEGRIGFARGEESVGERTVAGRLGACPSLMDSLALSISLALDPDAVDRPRRPRRPREVQLQMEDDRRFALDETPPTVVARLPLPPAQAPWRDAMAGRFSLLFGHGPGTPVGLQAAWSRRWDSWSMAVELQAAMSPKSSEAGVLVTSTVLTVAGTACLEAPRARACSLVQAGGLHGRGDGLDLEGGAWAPKADAGLRIGADLVAGSGWVADVTSEITIPMIRHVFRAGSSPIWQTPAAAITLAIGARWSGP